MEAVRQTSYDLGASVLENPIIKKIRDEISMVLQTAPMDENVQLETLYFLIILRSMNKKYSVRSLPTADADMDSLEQYIAKQ